MANPTFDRARELFQAFTDYCFEEGIFTAIDCSGQVRLYDLDSVLAIAEEGFSEYDDPILAMTETTDGSELLEHSLGYVEAGLMDMVI